MRYCTSKIEKVRIDLLRKIKSQISDEVCDKIYNKSSYADKAIITFFGCHSIKYGIYCDAIWLEWGDM